MELLVGPIRVVCGRSANELEAAILAVVMVALPPVIIFHFAGLTA